MDADRQVVFSVLVSQPLTHVDPELGTKLALTHDSVPEHVEPDTLDH